MPSTTVYPISTILGDWTPTPVTTDHHTLLDETVTDDADLIAVAGFSGGNVERLRLGPLPVGADRVTGVSIRVRVKGVAASNLPAIRLEVRVNGATIAAYEGGCSAASFTNLISTVSTDFLAAVWNAGVPELVITPLQGDIGYPDINEEA